MTWEHLTPRAKGGKDGTYNLAVACQKCNYARGKLPLLQFLVERQLLHNVQNTKLTVSLGQLLEYRNANVSGYRLAGSHAGV